jgi:hypothetical protein
MKSMTFLLGVLPATSVSPTDGGGKRIIHPGAADRAGLAHPPGWAQMIGQA